MAFDAGKDPNTLAQPALPVKSDSTEENSEISLAHGPSSRVYSPRAFTYCSKVVEGQEAPPGAILFYCQTIGC